MASFPEELVPASARPGDLLYGLDSKLRLLGANETWRAFARENGGEALLDAAWDGDALAGFSGSEKLRWQAIYAALLAGHLDSHEEQLMCPSPTERRGYQLRITARRDAGGQLTCLVHHMVLQRISEVSPAKGPGGGTQSGLFHTHRADARSRVERAPSFRASQCWEPLEEVGGDLLWHWERTDGTTDIVLADVVGHGAAAARIAYRISSLLDDLAPASGGVSAKVSALNRAWIEQRSGAPEAPIEFATGLYMRLNPLAWRLDVCSFAHEGPIFSNAGRVKIPTGLPIGIMAEIEQWPQASLDLHELGERVMLCSDGVTEQFDERGEMFGVERLERYFLQGRGTAVSALVPALMERVDAFRGSALVKDDRALLVVELAR